MLCGKCKKNPATTHIHTVINGVAKDVYLCAECAKDEGVHTFSANGLGGMLSSLFGDVLSLNPASNTVRCACCGSTFSDIAKTGKAGCPDCYKTFYNEFLPYIKRVHGSVKHVGTAPGKIAEQSAPQVETPETLRAQLKELIAEEKFEQAAQVRDKIKELEAGK